MAEAERTVTAIQLADAPQSLLRAVNKLENEIMDAMGNSSWIKADTSNAYIFKVRGHPRLVTAWTTAVDKIIEYKPQARGW